MALRINSVAPNFVAQTTLGEIQFHDWIGNGWAILFSHPKDFTPVCTTELGYMAGLQDKFADRNCKVIGLSVDPVARHSDWIKDIEPLNRAFHLSDYNQHCQPIDVGAMVFVQCDCGDDQGVNEARWIAELAEEDPRIKGIVAFAPIEKEAELKPYLEQ